MSALIDENDQFDVKFVIGKSGKHVVVAADKESLTKAYSDVTEIEEHKATFRGQGFLLDAIILDHSIETVDGLLKMNANLLRVNRLKGLLVKWTLKNKSGQIIEINDKNIENLNRHIGNYLSSILEDAFGVI